MKVLVTGATGFVGQRLCAALEDGGHTVVGVSRSPSAAAARGPALAEVHPWHPSVEPVPAAALAGVEAVVHLVGEPIKGRWTTAKKRAIGDSRELSTRHLIDGIEARAERPRVLISSSASGYYGDRGEESLAEETPPGSDFLAGVCRRWESEAARATRLGMRAVQLRQGLVMGEGSALALLRRLTLLGLGGPLGSGRQWWPWIHLDDLVGLIQHVVDCEEIVGPLNAVAPQALRQRDFARTLGRVLGRPALLPAPAFALRLVLGEMAVELLASRRLSSARAETTGFHFRFPELEPALRDVLRRGRAD